jgi:two-component system sensor histidine kinase DegS
MLQPQDSLPTPAENVKEAAEDPKQLIQTELEDASRSLKEITLMLEQSRVEVSKLTQRNQAVATHLQQIQAQIEKTPASEIRSAYDSALDTQQRLYVMRGQIDKLQNDQGHLQNYKKTLEHLLKIMQEGGSRAEKSAMTSVEMLVNTQEAERQRLSKQIHDGPAQAMSNFILQAEIAMRLMDIDVGQARAELAALKTSAMATFQKIRNFIFDLRPMMLDDLGLAPTIRRYAEYYKEQFGAEVSVTLSGSDRRLEPYIEVLIFRAMQELLDNAVQKNQATQVKVQLDNGDAQVKLLVDDNGKGMDPESMQKTSSLNLRLIKERAEMLGGTFMVDSAPGMGARISVSIPAQQ